MRGQLWYKVSVELLITKWYFSNGNVTLFTRMEMVALMKVQMKSDNDDNIDTIDNKDDTDRNHNDIDSDSNHTTSYDF